MLSLLSCFRDWVWKRAVAAAGGGMLSYRCRTRCRVLKKLVLCDEQAYYIGDEDFETLKRISPGLARLGRETDRTRGTHFVCGQCGQICPVKLRELHDCGAPRGQQMIGG